MMQKITFATLKKFARLGKLSHRVDAEFNGMYDGMEYYDSSDRVVSKTTLDDLARFKVSKNWLTVQKHMPSIVVLSNCCFKVTFSIDVEGEQSEIN